jgi:hypothetical protein
MTFEQFDNFQDGLLAEVVSMKNTKGREYANSESRFANFDRLSVELGLTNIQIGWVYLAKHLDAIRSRIRTGQTFSTEPIHGRIVDAITYLTLIAGMIEESECAQREQIKKNGKIILDVPEIPTYYECRNCGLVEAESISSGIPCTSSVFGAHQWKDAK